VCGTNFFHDEARWLASRDINFPCRGEMGRVVRRLVGGNGVHVKNNNSTIAISCKTTFSLSRRDVLRWETLNFLVEARCLALRDLNLDYRIDMACATGSPFRSPGRDHIPSETMCPMGPLFSHCRGDKACSARHQFVLPRRGGLPNETKAAVKTSSCLHRLQWLQLLQCNVRFFKNTEKPKKKKRTNK
jgi:hypothetical protein